MSFAASLVAAAFPGFGTATTQVGTPPQPYAENVTLPGQVPAQPQDVPGEWLSLYTIDDVRIGDETKRLNFTLQLHLRDDGTYHLLYSARWGSAFDPGGQMKVEEEGKYSQSGEILLLEPRLTTRTDIKSTVVVKAQEIPGENQVWIVRAGKKSLHLAGRCAKYRVEPVCHTSPNVWFSLKPGANLLIVR